MNTSTRTVTAFLGVLCLLVLAGCPKKAVVTPPAAPKTEAPGPPPEFRWDLRPIHFDFDRSDIRPHDASVLDDDYAQMRSAAAQNQKPGITIEGYCDPIGTAEYNMALGMRRAEAARAYLLKLGADSRQLSTISYGEEKLVTQDPGQYEMNRRCEFKVGR